MKIKNNDLTVCLSNGTKFSFNLTDKVYVKDGVQVPVYRIDLFSSTLPEKSQTLANEEFALFGKEEKPLQIGEPICFKSLVSQKSDIVSDAVVESINKDADLKILKTPDVAVSKYVSFETESHIYTFERNEIDKSMDEPSFTYLEECSTHNSDIFSSPVFVRDMGIGASLHILNSETGCLLRTGSVLDYKSGNDKQFLEELKYSLENKKELEPLEY